MRNGPVSAVPLPPTLAGTSVEIVDAAGASFKPGLFFVNEMQANYLMPKAMTLGLATVIATAADGTQTRGYLNVRNVSPAQFVFNGDGLVAGAAVRVKPAGVKVTIGGEEAEVTFSGMQGQFEGLDQVNIKLPRGLKGRGKVMIQLTVDLVKAAPVSVTVQ